MLSDLLTFVQEMEIPTRLLPATNSELEGISMGICVANQDPSEDMLLWYAGVAYGIVGVHVWVCKWDEFPIPGVVFHGVHVTNCISHYVA